MATARPHFPTTLPFAPTSSNPCHGPEEVLATCDQEHRDMAAPGAAAGQPAPGPRLLHGGVSVQGPVVVHRRGWHHGPRDMHNSDARQLPRHHTCSHAQMATWTLEPAAPTPTRCSAARWCSVRTWAPSEMHPEFTDDYMLPSVHGVRHDEVPAPKRHSSRHQVATPEVSPAAIRTAIMTSTDTAALAGV
ncbi:hypothetical protein BRADI_3g28617v3 [Brachypodium distachyon]|uniref:Uncharacterized protein n=1 Tax=Brachypodium distachyon TaxID=15368 RepID=A0A2K2CZS1_BRADI|nr:hypothetical protein BRADI_3g28617v3 [Brachypodium distachyon]